jgi:hypothetical protein
MKMKNQNFRYEERKLKKNSWKEKSQIQKITKEKSTNSETTRHI